MDKRIQNGLYSVNITYNIQKLVFFTWGLFWKEQSSDLFSVSISLHSTSLCLIPNQNGIDNRQEIFKHKIKIMIER